MSGLREQLPARPNRGLRLRWELALNEMEAYSEWSFDETEAVINAWSFGLISRVVHCGANCYALWSRRCSRALPAHWASDGEALERWSPRREISY